MDLSDNNSASVPYKVVRIGCDDSNEIVIKGVTVYDHHAEFDLYENVCVVRDLTKTENFGPQTFIAPLDSPNHRIPIVEPYRASYDDIVYLGSIPFPLERLLDYLKEQIWEKESGQTISVGAATGNRIVIKGITVSPLHAEFKIKEDGCLIRDCGSQMGTFLVDSKNPEVSKPITTGNFCKASYSDIILLGSYPFPLSRLQDIKDIYLEPGKTHFRIGRAVSNDRPLDDTKVSNYHAQFIRTKKNLYLEDLGSISGTFLNGNRLPYKTRQIIRIGDIIRAGSYKLSVESEEIIRVEYVGDIKLDVENARCTIYIRGRPAFDDISFSIYPGEFLGIMGPSGHGKSLLLESIRDGAHLSSGNVKLNGEPLEDCYHQFQSSIGYVPQNDILFPQLTVSDSLYYTAKQWFWDTSDAEIKNKVNTLLSKFEIREDVRGRRIAIISGGERKRVNIAHELIREPKLLFLDEPTTGLSVSDAKTVMGFLREYADLGNTVIAIIHQPGLEVYNKLDLVGIFFWGRIIYFGHRQYCIHYFRRGGEHPDSIFDVLSEIDAKPGGLDTKLEELNTKFLHSREYQLALDRLKE